jgi:cyanate permease
MAHLPAPADAARTHWPAVLAAAFSGVAIAVNVGKVPLALGELRSEFALSLVQAGWVSSALTTLAVFSALGVGLVAGRIGALRMVLGGLLLGALASLAALVVPFHGAGTGGFGRLIATRLIEGAGFLAVAVAAPSLVSAAAAPADRRFALGIWATYMPAGAGLAMAASPLLLPLAGWRGLWALAVVALLAAAALCWAQRRHYATGTALAMPLRPTLAVLRQPLPWLYALAFGAWALQHFALIVWMPTFLREQRGLGPTPVALLTGAMLLACVPGNLLGGALLQRGVARGRLIAVAHTVTGLCGLACFSDALPDGLRYALCVALSFTGGLVPSAVLSASAVLARGPQQISAIQGLVMQISQLGQFIGTPLIAAVVAASGHWASARWVTGGAALLGVGLGLTCWALERRPAR